MESPQRDDTMFRIGPPIILIDVCATNATTNDGRFPSPSGLPGLPRREGDWPASTKRFFTEIMRTFGRYTSPTRKRGLQLSLADASG